MTGESAIVVAGLGMVAMFGWFVLSMKYLGKKITGWPLAVLLFCNVAALFYFGIRGWLYAPDALTRAWCGRTTIMFAVTLAIVGALAAVVAWNIRRAEKEGK